MKNTVSIVGSSFMPNLCNADDGEQKSLEDGEAMRSEAQARLRKWIQELPDFKSARDLMLKRKNNEPLACSSDDIEDSEGWDDPALHELNPPASGMFSCLIKFFNVAGKK